MNIAIRHFICRYRYEQQLDECEEFGMLLKELHKLGRDVAVPWIYWYIGFDGLADVDGYVYDYDMEAKRSAFITSFPADDYPTDPDE
ncbi:hypothetical protein PHISCL_00156 [Aspergillus sclerotialis]|uniref:Uncharacterized protein n=1 Tax=Aspergillus sclerotialis TaxID=2070753 RepID=A0A3A2ZXW7_9EURO|nr:hypothetical protein PHISCL_00156 [Aspergillus sclerotialis]